MKKKLMKIYNFFHICKPGQLYSVTTHKTCFDVIDSKVAEYRCSGFFCDKKIKVRII